MTTVYQLIGKYMFRYWLVKYRRQIRVGAGIATVVALAAAYGIATRQPPEG